MKELEGSLMTRQSVLDVIGQQGMEQGFKGKSKDDKTSRMEEKAQF